MQDYSYYTIVGVDKRSPLHGFNMDYDNYVGQLCYIGYLQTGERAYLNVVPKNDDRFHAIHTSTVDDYMESDNGNLMTIDTMNTRYHLRRAAADEINRTLSRLSKKPRTTPIKGYGFYGE